MYDTFQCTLIRHFFFFNQTSLLFFTSQNTTVNDLNSRVEELKMENEYQLRLKDMTYNEKMKELTEKFIQEMESLKTKNQVKKRAVL